MTMNRKHYPMTDRTYQQNYLRPLLRAGGDASKMTPAERIELYETLIDTNCVSLAKATELQAEIITLRAQLAQVQS